MQIPATKPHPPKPHARAPPPNTGQLQFVTPAAAIPHLREGRLLEMVAALLREERDAVNKAGFTKPLTYDPAREGEVGKFSYAFNNGWTPGVLSTSLANSSNAVMRC